MPDERWERVRAVLENVNDEYGLCEDGRGVVADEVADLHSLRREHEAALAALGKLREWALEHGAALVPPSTDSYGDGMRDAKQQVHSILDRAALDAAKAGGER